MRRVAVAVPRDEHKVLRAVIGGDHRLVEEYIEEDIDLTPKTAVGHTALHVAAARGLGNMLRVLLLVPSLTDHKDDQDDEGRTALWVAAANGEVESVNLLLECGASALIAAHNGETALHVALAGAWGRVAETLLSNENALALCGRCFCGATEFKISILSCIQYFPAALECLEALADYQALDFRAQDEEGKTALAWACEMGADLAAELLINKAPDTVFIVDKRKRNPVHWAMLGEAPIMSLKHILRATKDDTPVDAADDMGLTPLHLAALNGHALVAKLLITSNANAKCADTKGRTLAHASAVANSSEMWQLLGEQEGFDFDARDAEGRTALAYAALLGRPHALIGLLTPKLAIDVNNEDLEKCTPLYWAAYAGNTKGVQRLLSAGASVRICDSLKRTPMHVAAIFGHSETLLAIVSKTRVDHTASDRMGNTALHLLAARGHDEIAAWLIKTEGKELLEARNTGGRTPLHLAAALATRDCVRTLLELGADITAVDKKKRTCLHFAISSEGSEPEQMLELLLATPKALSVNARDAAGRTAMHLAAALGRQDCVKILLAHGANPDLTDSAGRTPLHLASYFSDPETAERLLASNAQCFLKRDNKGRTPLHLAVLQTAPSGDGVLSLLLKQQGALEATDSAGRTPLHYAALSDMPRLFDLAANACGPALTAHLLRADKRGQTALHLAAFRGSLSVYQTLLDLLTDEQLGTKDSQGRTVAHILVIAFVRSDAGAVAECLQMLHTRAAAAALFATKDASGRTPADLVSVMCANSPALLLRLRELLTLRPKH